MDTRRFTPPPPPPPRPSSPPTPPRAGPTSPNQLHSTASLCRPQPPPTATANPTLPSAPAHTTHTHTHTSVHTSSQDPIGIRIKHLSIRVKGGYDGTEYAWPRRPAFVGAALAFAPPFALPTAHGHHEPERKEPQAGRSVLDVGTGGARDGGDGMTRQHEAGEKHGEREEEDPRHGAHEQRTLVGMRQTLGRLPCAREEVVGILTCAVKVVVLDVARDRVDAVLQCPLLGPLTRARKVGLERARARIGLADHIRMVRPHVAVDMHKLGVLLHLIARSKDADRRKLLVEHPPCQRTLDDIGAVQTVHAVGAHHGALLAHHLAALGGKVVGALEPLGLQPLDEVHDALKLHALALVVEVVVGVVHVRVGELLDGTLVRLLDRLLVALLVDEVDEVVVAVALDLVVKVAARSFRRLGLLHDLQIGLVAQIVHLGPEDGHGAARLHVALADRAVGLDHGRAALGVGDDKLLGLVEVGHVAVQVDAARKKAKHARQHEARHVVARLCRLYEALHQEAVPEEAVVGALPQRRGLVGDGRLALHAAREVVSVAKVERGAVEVRLEQAQQRLFHGMLEERRIGLLLERQHAELGGHVDVGACDLGDLLLGGDHHQELGGVQLDDADQAVHCHRLGIAAVGGGALLGDAHGRVVAVDHERFGARGVGRRGRLKRVRLGRDGHAKAIQSWGRLLADDIARQPRLGVEKGGGGWWRSTSEKDAAV
ncbi:hypothetical protein L1887_58497 [Cichorium endivia]|nr:hypothetical protein L1887_58497 [Cichorium endivia]